MKPNLMIKCSECNSSANVRFFCDVHIPFKQTENGCFSMVEDTINPENIKEKTIKCECIGCDRVIDLTEDQKEDFIKFSKY